MKYEIEEGAPAPVTAAGGTSVPAEWRDAAGQVRAAPLQMHLAADEEARSNGEFLVERVRDFVKRLRRRDDDVSIRELRRMVAFAPSLTLSIVEFLEYIAELLRKGRRQAVAHILAGVGRGRPLDQHRYLVAMVDLVRQQGGARSDAAACAELRKLPNTPFSDISVERMRIIYSERRELLRALRSYHVSEQDLARVPRDLLDDIMGACAR